MSVFDDPTLFGRLWADTYDETSSPDPTAAVEFLAALAGDGPVLELAVGTGRVALPLAARGLIVEGIEASPEMIAVMRAKPGGDAVSVVVGDMADVEVTGPYPLVYLVYNTLFNLTGAGRQEDCFRNVARVLAPGGAFVVEAYMPEVEELDEERKIQVRSVTEESVELRVHRYDYEAQTVIRQTVIIRDGSDLTTVSWTVLVW
jgi:SAM-dependent methyltransferase